MSKAIAKLAERFNSDEKELIATLKNTAFKTKDGVATDAQMQALCIVADQYGLNPFLKEIYAYPDKQNGIVPVVGLDGWTRIINSHPQFNGMAFTYSNDSEEMPNGKKCPAWCEVTIYRKDREHPVIVREFLDEVYRDAFTGKGQNGKPYTINGPWQTHTKRMLRHKTLIQGARLAFGFAGIYDEDEAQRIQESEAPRIDHSKGQVIEGKWSSEPETITHEQAEQLRTLIANAGIDETKFCADPKIAIGCLEEFPSARFEGAKNYLSSLAK